MTPERKQEVFDAIAAAVELHAPFVALPVRVKIATDASLKIAGFGHPTNCGPDCGLAGRCERRDCPWQG